MHALVCVKAVAREAPRVRTESGAPVFERAGRLILNESDAYAVDEAVRLAKQHDARVTAVSVGPLTCQDALCTALAKGAGEALRVDAETDDPLAVARLLAAVVHRGRYDLILTGVESWEELASAVAPALAALLDRPFASCVNRIEIADGGQSVRVTREFGRGRFQTLVMPLPAVLSVQSGICPLRVPATARVRDARRRPPKSLSPAALGVELRTPAASLVEVFAPQREREAEMIDGSPAEIAGALLDRIEKALQS